MTSVAAGGQIPAGGSPIIALVGRSNVGKSSLINALFKSRIARAGAKPGTTRLLNVYRVTEPPRTLRPFVIVDLPGYGYARGGLRARQDFEALTTQFFSQVDTLAGLLLVVDIRHPGLDSDVAALEWARESEYPLVVVLTKADRVSRAAARQAGQAHADALGRPDGPLVVVSARTGAGVRQVWAALKELPRLL